MNLATNRKEQMTDEDMKEEAGGAGMGAGGWGEGVVGQGGFLRLIQ